MGCVSSSGSPVTGTCTTLQGFYQRECLFLEVLLASGDFDRLFMQIPEGCHAAFDGQFSHRFRVSLVSRDDFSALSIKKTR